MTNAELADELEALAREVASDHQHTRAVGYQGIVLRLPAILLALRGDGKLREALVSAVREGNLLLQNAEGCAVNHYGEDFGLHGMPGWLVEARANLEAAHSALNGETTTEETTDET